MQLVLLVNLRCLFQKKLPPVRNKDYKSKMRAKKKKSEAAINGQAKGDGDKKDPRIKSYDYSSWEKFDVVYINALK